MRYCTRERFLCVDSLVSLGDSIAALVRARNSRGEFNYFLGESLVLFLVLRRLNADGLRGALFDLGQVV